MLFSKVVNAFALLSLIIAGLGLFGLASFSILRRTKEIGIRKVLGASGLRIARMILSEYLLLIGLAYLISLPVLYYVANSWLENYALRVDLGFIFFLLPLLISLAIGLISVSYQTNRATSQNPVKSLRYE
ncbi:MAG: FtsX-like permease family protein [Cyclobacteriaceae bacterium]